MDETAVRSLLERVAESDGPPCTVDLARARKVGRRRLWLRRACLQAAPAVALTVAAALAVTGMMPFIPGASRRPVISATREASPGAVTPPAGGARVPRFWLSRGPAAFSPLAPIATFGWLPAGYALDGGDTAVPQITQQSELVLARSKSGGQEIYLSLAPAGQCRLLGPPSGAPGSVSHTAGTGQYSQVRTLTCGTVRSGFSDAYGPDGPLVDLPSQAPELAGWIAFWSYTNSLVFQYAPRSWARLSVSGLRASMAATRHLLVQLARNIRYSTVRSLTFPFRLTGLPASWEPSQSTLGVAGDRLVGIGLELGPARAADGLSISAAPAGVRQYCTGIAGQPLAITANGVRGTLRTLDQPGAGYSQNVCFEDYHGLALSVTSSLGRPNGNSPESAARGKLGVLGIVLHQLVLFGPDPANWTTSPLAR